MADAMASYDIVIFPPEIDWREISQESNRVLPFDRTKALPIFLDLSHPDAHKIQVFRNGKPENNFIEVDVLGCTGVRIMMSSWGFPMRDDDGNTRHERVYGHFKLEWIAQPSLTLNFDGSG